MAGQCLCWSENSQSCMQLSVKAVPILFLRLRFSMLILPGGNASASVALFWRDNLAIGESNSAMLQFRNCRLITPAPKKKPRKDPTCILAFPKQLQNNCVNWGAETGPACSCCCSPPGKCSC